MEPCAGTGRAFLLPSGLSLPGSQPWQEPPVFAASLRRCPRRCCAEQLSRTEPRGHPSQLGHPERGLHGGQPSPPGAWTICNQTRSAPADAGEPWELPPSPARGTGSSSGASSARDRRRGGRRRGRTCTAGHGRECGCRFSRLSARGLPWGAEGDCPVAPHMLGTFLWKVLSPWSKPKASTTLGKVRPGDLWGPAGKRAFLPVPNRSPA